MNRLRIILDLIALIVSLICISLAAALAIGGACMAAILALGFGGIPDFLILSLWIIIPAIVLGGGIYLTWKFGRQTSKSASVGIRGVSAVLSFIRRFVHYRLRLAGSDRFESALCRTDPRAGHSVSLRQKRILDHGPEPRSDRCVFHFFLGHSDFGARGKTGFVSGERSG